MSADTRLWTKDFVAVTLANFFLMINYFILIVVMADYAMTTFDASPALAGTASVFFVVYSASMLMTRPQAGRIFDRRGHRGPAILRADHRRAGAPAGHMGLANSTCYILMDIAVGFGPAALGLLQPLTGYRGMYAGMALLCLCCLPVCARIRPRGRR